MRRVVVLRPEPGATATVERARELGLEAFSVPLFRLLPRAWAMPALGEVDGLLLTSANAARLAGERLAGAADLTVHAVGAATAAAAREAGLRVDTVGSGGVDALLASLPTGQHLVHLCGEDRREPQAARHRITPIVVYAAEAIERPDLGPLAGAVAMVHSPRAGARLADLFEQRASIAVAAISPAAAAACGAGWERVGVAERPDDAALLSLAARMCQESQPE